VIWNHANFISFLFLYGAFIDFGLKRPYEFLFLELKKSERDLEHKASFSIINPNPVLEMDVSGKVIFLNPAAEKIIQDLGTKEADEVFIPEEKKHLLDKLAKGETISEYSEIKLGDKCFGLNSFTVPDLNVIRVYALDITDLRRTEEELRKSQQELLKKTEEQLEESYRHMGTINRKISIILEVEKYSKNGIITGKAADFIVQSAVNLSGAKIGILYEYKEGKFKLVSHCGLNYQETAFPESIFQREIEFLDMLVRDKKRVSGFCNLTDMGPLNIDKMINYFVAIPLVNKNPISGFIFLGFKGERSLDNQDLEFLEVFSLHAGIFFSKDRKFSKV